MAESLPSVDFRRIREHGTSQQRAFEELCYALVPTIEQQLPSGTLLERRGTPDGGIEFSCRAPDGNGTWAWQAKYLFDFSAARGQMGSSAARAVALTADLTRYAFLLPTERSGGQPTRNGKPHGQSGLEKWADDVKQWKESAQALGRDVEFVYIGESDLLAALVQDKHAGDLRYYFDTVVLTDQFCAAQVAREIVNLGVRYVPKVNVELEIASRVDALALTPAFRDEVRDALGRLRQRLNSLMSRTGVEAMHLAEVEREVGVLLDDGSAADSMLTIPDTATHLRIRQCIAVARERVEQAQERLREMRRDHRERKMPALVRRGDGRDVDLVGDALFAASDNLYELDGALQALEGLVELALSPPVLLITGPAGCGKSHLVADVASRRTRSGLTTMLLLGRHFIPGPVWPQIAAQTGLDLTPDDLLATLSAAAQMRGRGRALLVIDALNDGSGAQVWPDQLGGLLRAVVGYPWVAVVLTVRDVYREAVLPDFVAAGVPSITHPGLAGHEEQALEVYARHFELRLPDFPPLQPEVGNPLFLRALCQSIRGRGLSAVPREAVSLSWVFDGLVDGVNKVLSDPNRLDYRPSDRLVHRAVEELAGLMLGIFAESVPWEMARAVCEKLLPSNGYSRSLLNGLITEGLLLQETAAATADRPGEEYIRFAYLRLSDHLRARQLLAGCADHTAIRTRVASIIDAPHWWLNLGLIEALTLVLPESHGIELIDLLGPQAARRQDAWWNHRLGEHLLDSLAWRSIASISPRTLQLAETLAASHRSHRARQLAVTLSVACIPDHPLNSRWRDAQLRPLNLPDRDAGWSFEILGIWGEDPNPVARLINWAWSGHADFAARDAVKLAAQTLVWLLTSPNRLLRDSATKALTRLTDRHSDVLAELVGEYACVNDPYVVERVLAVAYGHWLRHRHDRGVRLELSDLLSGLRPCSDALRRLGF